MVSETEVNRILVQIVTELIGANNVKALESQISKLAASISKLSAEQLKNANINKQSESSQDANNKKDKDSIKILDERIKRIQAQNTATIQLLNTDKKYAALKAQLQTKGVMTDSGELSSAYSQLKVMSTTSPIINKWDETTGTRISNLAVAYKESSGEAIRTFDNTRTYLNEGARSLEVSFGKLFEKFNALRWSLVNITFVARTLSMLAKPFIDATKAGMEWELQLKRIQMVNVEVLKTSQDMANVSDILLTSRKGTPYSAVETSSAFLEYTKAGFSIEEATEALPHILDLSIIGMVDLASAGTIVAQTMHSFAIEGISAEKAVNIIALAANKSALSVETFGNSLSYVGPIAANMGIKLSETAAALSLLSNAGLRGTMAGTSLRQVLSSMAEPTADAEELMKRLGISYHDVDGNAKGLTERLKTLYYALEGLTAKEKEEALGKLFDIRGKVAVAAFLNLLRESTTELEDMANLLETDVSYSSEAVGIAMESSMLKMRKSMNDLNASLIPMRDTFVQSFTKMLDVITPVVDKMAEFNQEHPVAGQIAGYTGQVGAGIGLTLGTIGAIGGVKSLIAGGGAVAQFFTGAAGAIGAVLHAIVAALPIIGLVAAAIGSVFAGFKMSEEGGWIDKFTKHIDTITEKGSVLNEVLKNLSIHIFGGPGIALGHDIQRLWENFTTPSDEEVQAAKLKEQEEVMKEAAKLEKEYLETRQRALDYFREEYQGWVDDLKYANMPVLSDFETYIEKYEEFINEFSGSSKFRAELEKNKQFIQDQIPVVIDYYNTIESENKIVSELNKSLKAQNDILSTQKDLLGEVNNQIKVLSGARYTGQLDVEVLMENVDQSIKRNKWNTYGLGDAYSWLQSQLNATTIDYDEYLTIVEKVNDEVENSESKFKAWQETIREFIRNQIEQGNDLRVNMSDTVRSYSTLLLQTEKYGESQKKEKTGEEAYLSLLNEAYDLYYGSMQNNVKLAIQANEDEKNGVYSNSSVVIRALQKKWNEQSKYETAIKLTEDSIKDLDAQLTTHNTKIDETTAKITALKNSVLELVYALDLYKNVTLPSDSFTTQIDHDSFIRKLADSLGVESPTDLISENVINDKLSNIKGFKSFETALSTILGVTIPESAKESIVNKYVSSSPKSSSSSSSIDYMRTERQKQIDAGIIKPTKLATGGIVTQPTFAMIGEAGPEMVVPLNRNSSVGNTNLNINQLTISGVSGDYNVFAREFINTIKRELRSI